MGVTSVDRYETRTPDAEGWRGVPFRCPGGPVAAGDEGGKHDGGADAAGGSAGACAAGG